MTSICASGARIPAMSSSPIRKIRRLQREVSRLRPGDNVDLRVYANGDYRSVRLRVARASDLPRRRGFMISGDGMGMGMGMMPGGLPARLRRRDHRRAGAHGDRARDERRGPRSGGRRPWSQPLAHVAGRDEELPKKRVEPIEPIHIEPLEPSRFRRVAAGENSVHVRASRRQRRDCADGRRCRRRARAVARIRRR